MSMDSVKAMDGSEPKYISAASVIQNEQHLWHLAILAATPTIASDKPRCCMRVPTIIDINAIHIIRYATVIVNDVSLIKFLPQEIHPITAMALTEAPCAIVTVGAVAE